jgi:hypothetical protein
VIHPGLNGGPEHGKGLVAVARRPEHPVAGELHRAVPDP